MRRIVMVLPVVLGLFFLTGISNINADHGGGTGGGCRGDCTPPTLGTDNGGKQIVRGGFAINGSAFDVTYFKQEIPTQTIKVNEPVIVTLTIFENSAPQFLRHVGLAIELEDEYVSRDTASTYPVQINWDKDHGGNTTMKINDPDDFVKDVNVIETIEGRNNVLTFEFTPTQVFDASAIIVKTWDAERNSWTNYFYDSMRTVQDLDVPDSIIPEWVKNNAGWWAEGAIDDDSFVSGLQYMITVGIITV